MAKVYAMQVISGKREIEKVPERWREDTALALREMGWEKPSDDGGEE